jgi:hypothetical protein
MDQSLIETDVMEIRVTEFQHNLVQVFAYWSAIAVAYFLGRSHNGREGAWWQLWGLFPASLLASFLFGAIKNPNLFCERMAYMYGIIAVKL